MRSNAGSQACLFFPGVSSRRRRHCCDVPGKPAGKSSLIAIEEESVKKMSIRKAGPIRLTGSCYYPCTSAA